MSEPTRRWSASTKRIVIVIILILTALVIYRFRSVIQPLMIAFLAAFILDPVVDFFEARLRLSRGAGTAILFLVLFLGGVAAVATPVSFVPFHNLRQAIISTQNDVIGVINEIGHFLDRPVEIWEYSFDLSGLYDEINSMLRSFVGSVARGTLDVLSTVASGAVWLIIIMITTFYLLKDADRMIQQIEQNLAPPGYREDIARLREQITGVWHAFLRGQLLMCLVIAVMTIVGGLSIGLPYAIVLGVLAGILEFIPNLGPAIAIIPAVLLALFRGSTFLPLDNFWFAVIVAGMYIIIQQIESNILVPRVMGHTLNLHPLVVLIGVIIGGNLGGILGVMLAAPVLATLRVIGYYVFCRLYDRDPFEQSQPEARQKPHRFRQAAQTAWRKAQVWITRMRRRSTQARQDVRLRPARPRDKIAVEAMCAQMGGDYIPEVWDEWLADVEGVLLVAELGRQVIGWGKLSRLSEGEWWLHGLRVHPDHRRRGIGGQLQAGLVAQARQAAPGGLAATLRFATSSQNEPVHHLAARDGFRRAAVYPRYRAAPLPSSGDALRRLSEADLPAAWALVEQSSRSQAASGLYEDDWQWKKLTRARLADCLAKEMGWGVEAGGELAALALLCQSDEGEPLHVGYVDGADAALPAILRGLRELAAQQGRPEVRFRPVDEPTLTSAAESAGYERLADHDIWIFELQLT